MYAGTDPITRRRLYLKSTVKTEQQAQIELGKLIEKASDGRQPESGAPIRACRRVRFLPRILATR